MPTCRNCGFGAARAVTDPQGKLTIVSKRVQHWDWIRKNIRWKVTYWKMLRKAEVNLTAVAAFQHKGELKWPKRQIKDIHNHCVRSKSTDMFQEKNITFLWVEKKHFLFESYKSLETSLQVSPFWQEASYLICLQARKSRYSVLLVYKLRFASRTIGFLLKSSDWSVMNVVDSHQRRQQSSISEPAEQTSPAPRASVEQHLKTQEGVDFISFNIYPGFSVKRMMLSWSCVWPLISAHVTSGWQSSVIWLTGSFGADAVSKMRR